MSSARPAQLTAAVAHKVSNIHQTSVLLRLMQPALIVLKSSRAHVQGQQRHGSMQEDVVRMTEQMFTLCIHTAWYKAA